MKEKRGIKPLIELLSDPSGAVKEAAANALSKINGQKVIQELILLLHSEEADLRNIAIEILQEIGEEVVEPLSLLLGDENHDIRKFACDILGNIGSPRAVPYLISALNDPHINVACAACEALGNIKDKKATEVLVKILKDKDRKWLVYNAVEALGKIGDSRAVEPLMQLSSSRDPLILFALIRTFGEIGDARVVDQILSWLDSATLSRAAVEALAKIAEKEEEKLSFSLKNFPKKVELLHKFLKDPDSKVRKDTAFLLGVIQDKKALPPLFSLLSQDEEEVREKAMRALLKIDPELTSLPREMEDRAREILEVFLYDNDKKLREVAGKALERFSPILEE
jgi:HEAT repeat protein